MSKPKLSINRQVNKSYQELYEEYLKVASFLMGKKVCMNLRWQYFSQMCGTWINSIMHGYAISKPLDFQYEQHDETGVKKGVFL